MIATSTASETEPDAPRIVSRLLLDAHAAGASDLHLQTVSNGIVVRWRIDGVLQDRPGFSGPSADRIIGRIKYLSRLKTYQDSLPQDGRIAAADAGLAEDVRVSTYPTVTGEKVVLRFFRSTSASSLDEIGLSLPVLAAFRKALAQPTGLILLTGPAGSGKSTTVHAALRDLAADGGRHIVTVEDPVEQIVPGVMQTEIHEARGLGWAEAVRRLLRQDPQVLVIGEIRDEETAGLAVRAALTGHLVMATLHAGSCQGVLERLRLMVPDPFAVAAALSLVVNQRLLRRVCAPCSGAGCSTCHGAGYHGRVPLAECIALDEPSRARLRAGDLETFQPDPNLALAAARMAESGLTDLREIRRVLGT